jgi:hypothetical protein
MKNNDFWYSITWIPTVIHAKCKEHNLNTTHITLCLLNIYMRKTLWYLLKCKWYSYNYIFHIYVYSIDKIQFHNPMPLFIVSCIFITIHSYIYIFTRHQFPFFKFKKNIHCRSGVRKIISGLDVTLFRILFCWQKNLTTIAE